MAHCQMPEEKNDFFAHLDQLGTSDDEDTISGKDDVQGVPKCDIRPTTNPNQGMTVGYHNMRSAKRAKQATISKMMPAETGNSSIASNLRPMKLSDERSATVATRKKRNSKPSSNVKAIPESDQMFAGLSFFFIPNDDIAKPRKVRIRSAVSYGACWSREHNSTITHVIVDHRLTFDDVKKALPDVQILETACLVRDTWLIDSIAYKHLQSPYESRFRVKGAPEAQYRPEKPQVCGTDDLPFMAGKKRKLQQDVNASNKKRLTAESEFDRIVQEVRDTSHLPLDQDVGEGSSFGGILSESTMTGGAIHDQSDAQKPVEKNAGFQCMKRNNGEDKNPNAKTIEILQDMLSHYEKTGDQWRTLAYRKAIGALKQQTALISTRDEARAIPQIGDKIADKIEEIVTTSRLKSLENVQNDPDSQVLHLFMGVYGVGLVQATRWLEQGYRTLADLKAKAKLNSNQRVGIEHYEDFQQRIPRAEVEQHARIVQTALKEVDTGLNGIIGGSYRRGNASSGDVDIVITKVDATIETIRTLMMDSVIPSLEKAGFLKVALASSTSPTQGSKWHGASCLPGQTTWRRIDLLFVPWSELGAAMIYFTGDDIFNRSLRLLAGRKGMRLNQHGLYTDVMRGKGRAKVNEGKLLESHDEMKIFNILGVPWRPPEDRKC